MFERLAILFCGRREREQGSTGGVANGGTKVVLGRVGKLFASRCERRKRVALCRGVRAGLAGVGGGLFISGGGRGVGGR